MKPLPNPYEAPTLPNDTEVKQEEIVRPVFGTFLLCYWLLEGGFKAYLLGSALARGFNPIPLFVESYSACHWLIFFLVSSFLIFETIGPWIGVYYLTGRRSRTIPMNFAMFKTLKVAGGLAILGTLLLMFYCELFGS